MNTLSLIPVLTCLHGAMALAGVIPDPLPASRYDKMLDQSPFAVATPTEAPAEKIVGWAENLYLGPVAHITKDGEEKDFVVVKSRSDPTGSFTLIGNAENSDGIQLVKLEWSENPAKAKAVVKKGTEFATLEVNQADFTNPPAPVQQPRPGVGPTGIPVPNAGNVIRRPTNTPAQPVIPRPTGTYPSAPNAAPAIQQGASATNNQNPNDRKRIRVINSQ